MDQATTLHLALAQIFNHQLIASPSILKWVYHHKNNSTFLSGLAHRARQLSESFAVIIKVAILRVIIKL